MSRTITTGWMRFGLVAAALLVAPTYAAAQAVTPVGRGELMYNEFIASGFLGQSHDGTIDAASKTGFGASFDYLHRGRLGAEFLAGFTPLLRPVSRALFRDTAR